MNEATKKALAEWQALTEKHRKLHEEEMARIRWETSHD